jgi:hypothetical protein
MALPFLFSDTNLPSLINGFATCWIVKIRGIFKRDFFWNGMSDEMLVRTTNYSERSGHGENKSNPFKNCGLRIANCKLKDLELKLYHP